MPALDSGLPTAVHASAHPISASAAAAAAPRPRAASRHPLHRNVKVRKESLTAMPLAMGLRAKGPVTSGGLSSSFRACRKEDTTFPAPSDQAARSSGPSTSPVREKPPQPLPPLRGKVSWPMKSVVGSVGRAMPKPNCVRAPKKNWNDMPVAGSVNGVVTWAMVVWERVERRSPRRRKARELERLMVT